jgi:flagellar biosynthesis anti-sigma factor FlgM
MRVDNSHLIQKVAGARPKGVSGVEGVGGSEIDSVQLSARAADVRAAMEAALAAPAIREERVAELSQQLEQGTLTMDGDSLAAKLLKR